MKTTGRALPSIGNGTVAWAVLDAAYDGDATETFVWTLRDGQPVIAAKLARFVAARLESGTDAAGHPVAIAATLADTTPARAYLVRLDTGAVRRLAFGSRTRFLDAVAIDAGCVIYSTSVRRDSGRGRSSLWTARLDGRTVTNSKRLRRGRRGVTFETVRADRPDRGDRLRGPARAWVAGSGFSLERVSLVTGRTKKLIDESDGYDVAYDPDSGRLLVAGGFGDVGSQIGWTKPFR